MVDAFSSGSGLADKKHFTVDVEHQFTTPPTSPFIEYIYFFPLSSLIFTFPFVLIAPCRRLRRPVALGCQRGGDGAADAQGSGVQELWGPRAPGSQGSGVPGLRAYRLWGPRAPGFAPSCSSTTAHRLRFCLTQNRTETQDTPPFGSHLLKGALRRC